jgi:1,4-alpha-glucan branching enzyme
MFEDEGGFDVITLVAVVIAATIFRKRKRGIPQHTSILTGQLFYNEVMDHDNVHKFRVVARMDKETFLGLRDLLIRDGNLEASVFLCEGQKLMIFMTALTGITNRLAADRWQHSILIQMKNSSRPCSL